MDASSLDRAADFGAFEITLQLRNPFAELLGQETSQSPLVIIDGLDRLYSDHAFRNVATLLRVVTGERPTTPWRILAVCQLQEWPRTLDALQRAGAPATRWSIHDARAPQPSELRPVREAVPALGRLLLQPRVGALFTNLKLLDLVVRRIEGGAQVDASSWVGESSVADWFWRAEIDRGQDRLARGQCARSLASLQADRLLASVPVEAIEAGSLSAAQSLTADQLLVQMPGDRLAFAHDLYGDWARLRILLNHRTDLTIFLKDRHQSPLWHRAIRLFGIHLLEHENGAAEWKRLMSSFSDGGMTVVQDLLLEAPAFAMNAGSLLNSVFPDLVAGEGALLSRLLTRFLAFATVPDEHLLERARADGMDDNAARAALRRPHWPYWLDVLAVLHTHRDDALRVAAPDVARIVEMWLECLSPGSIRRREAAVLGVMLGRRALDTGDAYSERASREDRKRFYKCALLAAAELPDDVADLAKIAAERISRPLPEGGNDAPLPRARSLFGTGVMRGPWPDGPLVRVDDAFRSVVLDGRSIQILYRVRPAVAREVILATLIEAPYEVRWGGGRMQAGKLDLVDDLRWQPSFFTHGPFLACLRENFVEGLELVMRLVEFATERSNEYATQELDEWRAQAAAAGQSEAEIEEAAKHTPRQQLVLSDGARELMFFGDEGSYGWSAGLTSPRGFSPLPPPAVASALMALEQYFYQRMDAGQDVAAEVTTTLQRSRSVAPLGVLCDLGKRQPQLFSGPLRALLSAPEIYSWELTKTLQGRSHLMIGAFNQGQLFSELANEFNDLGHRKRDMRNVALDCLLRSEEMQTFFAMVRQWWKKRRTDGEQLIEMAGQLDLWLDPANYQMREDPTHRRILVNVALERVQAERSNERQAVTDRMLVISFPVSCREILDKRQVQTDTQLEELWQAWMHIRELAKAGPALPGGEERFGDEYVNAITGGIAMFLWHGDWLSRHTNRREEVEGALESLVSGDPPALGGFRSEHDDSTWTWDCFLAEAAAMLWARNPRDARWRLLVAEMVFAEKYAAMRLLFTRCAEHRATLGDDLGRLRRLALDWAHVRDRVDVLRNWQAMVTNQGSQADERLENEIDSWIEEATASFVDGTLAPLDGGWNRFGEASRFSEIDVLRDGGADSRLMDFHVVRCSHEWLPLPNAALSPEERTAVLQFWRVAVDVVAARPRAALGKDELQYPDEDERWVIERVAAAVLQLRPNENAAQLWTPIVDLHSGAYSWPETFLNALHRCALSAEQTPATYGSLVRQIVLRACADGAGGRRWPWNGEVWDALLGFDWLVDGLWADRHAGHVVAIRDVIFHWMENAPQEGRRLGRFARWLSTPAAAPIRLDTLSWFRGRLQADVGHSYWRDEHTENDLAKLLNAVWDQDQHRLHSAPDAFAAFRGLLAWLVERQNARGLELQGRIGGLA